MAPAVKNLVVIGGSAGSTAVLRKLVAALPPDLPAAIIIVTHVPARGGGGLAGRLTSVATLPVSTAVDGQPIEPGHIYVAAADRHLLLVGETIRLGAGPRENMARPAIDPLFRSAALSFGSRVIGVVLSGRLNDGASGLVAIKQRGGTAVVQHPIDADCDSMPLAALEAAEVDHVVSADDLAKTLATIVGQPAGPSPAVSDGLRLDVEIAAGAHLGSDRLRTIAEPSALSCPECGGVLSEIRGSRPLRFRCQIGDGVTAAFLAARIDETNEAVRLAMRIMEERVSLVERLGRDAMESGRPAVAELYDVRAAEYRRYAAVLREAAVATLSAGAHGGAGI